jgi:cytochrome c peroxidase
MASASRPVIAKAGGREVAAETLASVPHHAGLDLKVDPHAKVFAVTAPRTAPAVRGPAATTPPTVRVPIARVPTDLGDPAKIVPGTRVRVATVRVASDRRPIRLRVKNRPPIPRRAIRCSNDPLFHRTFNPVSTMRLIAPTPRTPLVLASWPWVAMTCCVRARALRIARTVVALAAVFEGSEVVRAAMPGVPDMGATPADYVSYAVNDLPAWYRTPALQAADNTPADNPITNAGAELGRVLFYDDRLSHNDGTACASCHRQENGFSDPDQFSVGFEGGLTGRHSMGLTNARFYARGRFFWDERAATLEDQVLRPIQDAVEMGSNLPDLVSELSQTSFYPVLFERAFGDGEITADRMADAMAQFVRSMTSYQSKYDEALAAGPPGSTGFNSVLDPLERQGHAMFARNCARCHGTDAQVANRPENSGLDPDNLADEGTNGRFKVPSLRNIAVRDGFMHDGRFTTLAEVIEHYSTGIEANPTLGRGLPVGGFAFTPLQQQALLAFLNTLTDEAFLTSEMFSNPFVELSGDYDGNGIVDGGDLLVWQNNLGLTQDDVSGALWGDGDSDGVVGDSDLSVWLANLGARWDGNRAGTFPAANVPEPSAALLFGWLVLHPLRRRRSPP